MPRQIFTVDEMRRLLDQGAQLIDALEPAEYASSHLPGAVNIPLKALNEASAAQFDRSRPVIVYCSDFT